MQVMDALYQARVRKAETDLLIDQLKETLHYLTVQNKVSSIRYFFCLLISLSADTVWRLVASSTLSQQLTSVSYYRCQ